MTTLSKQEQKVLREHIMSQIEDLVLAGAQPDSIECRALDFQLAALRDSQS